MRYFNPATPPYIGRMKLALPLIAAARMGRCSRMIAARPDWIAASRAAIGALGSVLI